MMILDYREGLKLPFIQHDWLGTEQLHAEITLTTLAYLTWGVVWYVSCNWYENNQQSLRPYHALNKWQFVDTPAKMETSTMTKIKSGS